MAAVAGALRDGVATEEDLARLRALVGGAARPRRMRDAGRRHQHRRQPADQFPQVVARHLDNGCKACRSGAFARCGPYEVEARDAGMRIRLDRTMCDGFGVCAKHAPGVLLARRLGIRVARAATARSPPRTTTR